MQTRNLIQVGTVLFKPDNTGFHLEKQRKNLMQHKKCCMKAIFDTTHICNFPTTDFLPISYRLQ